MMIWSRVTRTCGNDRFFDKLTFPPIFCTKDKVFGALHALEKFTYLSQGLAQAHDGALGINYVQNLAVLCHI